MFMSSKWNNGMLKYRNIGVKTEGDHSIVNNSFKPIIPILHYSNIPIAERSGAKF